ncbi:MULTISPECIES: MFS transporter [Microbacterium]|uniref:MFS transporter, DHA1 family, arabinose polymer transporter n=1 Tax=Microbacterium paraoxydans TaxID=199592 RepID=A0A1H1WX33_9MICO|nr:MULTISPECIES: MFS transporter [Microbacterium]AMG84177.1 arabinose ABC transporter permease [Microbacterium sp. PAMC 28756]AVL96745.1 MFS transporter [Microbacterium sp. str. 'China']QXE31065.1 MFS transporter [Microbacterium paraoxydans]SDT01261.1 MFS transporter, DHA1 family, arabinose polymer transporter [Microbacterium paraoxydans]
MNPSTPSRGAAKWALLSLAIGSFGIGMTEFVVMGLLPNIAADLLPSVWASSQEEALSQAGWLISLYALGVVIGAPTIAGFVARYPRHRVMIVLALALTVFNALTVVLPTFELVGVSRFLAGLPHGAYFGIGALVAADVMGPGNRAKGVAFILTGLTVANVVGVPLGTFLGQEWGWRAAFAVVALVFALATVFIALFVPAHPGNPGRTMRAELGVFRIGQVWFTLGVGAIGFGGFFAVYSYIAPLVTEVAGSPDWVVPIVLVLMGLGMTGGNLVGGHLADIDLRRTLLLGLAAMAVVFALLAVLSFWIVSLSLVVVLVGFVSSVLSPTIQTRLMDVAGDNQSIAAAMNHSALNIGNSLGAFLGGIVIAIGWGFTAPAWTGAVLAVAGLLIALVSYRVEARRVAQTPVLAS